MAGRACERVSTAPAPGRNGRAGRDSARTRRHLDAMGALGVTVHGRAGVTEIDALGVTEIGREV
jgi:hypothetical protein